MLPRKTHLPQPDAGDSVTSLSARIRRARALAAISQAELAKRVGVQRSAVTQWECTAGTTPSVGHLIQIACETAVCFEWLATGRGPSRAQEGLLDAAVQSGDFARDELESSVLVALRRASQRKRVAIAQIIELLTG
ncbi:helix-turn-helix domain-containing protein [Xanthomonas citri pv. citri]|uniref:helix-turn-helix domain-containing protein n=1 Tax=Xanthomonas TaxID=338 RepID=UPI0002C3D843|nr:MULTISPECIES: helix-turn-helix domain-containing protein [Xanthomonas]AGI07696.1 Transcriptional regulator [Xanthomonas citri subsp. citri Aw12879]UIX77084.1 helix-turn-helix domain containing protein [Xanthomonas citri pv. glycines]WLA21838.1 helix-turn-helix domain containing protein [Xanthomonas citri pv. glycines]WLA31300.1 helix-turn-helix domain containing protein [Xanthomonas citri pv. glycines]